MGECAVAERDGYVGPSKSKLEEIGPGCYVQKTESNGSCCWVEITSMERDSTFQCIAHPALSKGTENDAIREGDQDFVSKDQISALGCDRFCFC